MARVCIHCFFFVLMLHAGFSQQPSNAYLIEWANNTAGNPEITTVELLTGFNQQGYNNQPFFNLDHLYLSSSWKEESPVHTNLYTFDLHNKTVRQITNTRDSEYSPIKSNKNLYFVRLDQESKYQELWKYDGQNLRKAIPETNVAYYRPISEDRLAVVLIENNQLNLYDINLTTNEKLKVQEDVGRSMAVGNKEVLYFVHKYSPDLWYIKSYDLFTGQIKIVSKTLPESEDFYLESNHIWMAKDQRIYRINIQNSLATTWELIFNLESYELNNIGRLCVIGSNQLIFINQ